MKRKRHNKSRYMNSQLKHIIKDLKLHKIRIPKRNVQTTVQKIGYIGELNNIITQHNNEQWHLLKRKRESTILIEEFAKYHCPKCQKELIRIK